MPLNHSLDSHAGHGGVTISTRKDGQHHVSVNILAHNATAVVAMLQEAIEYIDPPADYADGGVTAAAIENDFENGTCCGPLDEDVRFWHARWHEAADQRDARDAMAALWKETAREHIGRAEVYKEWMYAAHEKAECHDCIRDAAVIEKTRPLTPDDITSVMVTRAVAANYTPAAREGITGYMRHILTAALTEPQRPEGAEELADAMEGYSDDGRLEQYGIDGLADHLAAMGYRKTTAEENR